MRSDDSRITALEVQIKDMKEEITRFREHISKLLTFKSSLEGGLGLAKWLLGLVGLSSVAQLSVMIYNLIR